MRQATLTVNYILLAVMVSGALSLIGTNDPTTGITLFGFAMIASGNIVSIVFAHRMADK